MHPHYLYVDADWENESKYQGICVRVGDTLVNREFSGDIEADARKTGEFLCKQGATEWLNASSIDNYLYEIAFDAGLEDPEVDLRECVQEGYYLESTLYSPPISIAN